MSSDLTNLWTKPFPERYGGDMKLATDGCRRRESPRQAAVSQRRILQPRRDEGLFRTAERHVELLRATSTRIGSRRSPLPALDERPSLIG
jgi:hypothetical protein